MKAKNTDVITRFYQNGYFIISDVEYLFII